MLVHSGCYNRTTIDWVLTNSRNLLLSVLEAGSLRSWCQRGWMRALFQVIDLYPRMAEGTKDSSPICEASTLVT